MVFPGIPLVFAVICIVTNTKWACFTAHNHIGCWRREMLRIAAHKHYTGHLQSTKLVYVGIILFFPLVLFVCSSPSSLRTRDENKQMLMRQSISLCMFSDAIRFVAWQNLLLCSIAVGLRCARWSGLEFLSFAHSKMARPKIADVNKLHAFVCRTSNHRKFRARSRQPVSFSPCRKIHIVYVYVDQFVVCFVMYFVDSFPRFLRFHSNGRLLWRLIDKYVLSNSFPIGVHLCNGQFFFSLFAGFSYAKNIKCW